jgi:chemotaxis protein methyltransferase CheR
MTPDTTVIQQIEKYCAAVTGLHVPETLRPSVEEFILQRCAHRGCDVEEYLNTLDADPAEFARFITAVTINETYFFREERQFGALEASLLTECALHSVPVKIWSATCATGEEALSLYCMASRVLGAHRIMVFATDIDQYVLDIFAAGIYRSNSFREDGARYHKMIHERSVPEGRGWRFPPEIITAIHRSRDNISALGETGLPDDFAIIFFRNTLIYFNYSERPRIIDAIVRRLRPGGVLFFSVTETALVSHPSLSLECRDNVYFFRKALNNSCREGARHGH